MSELNVRPHRPVVSRLLPALLLPPLLFFGVQAPSGSPAFAAANPAKRSSAKPAAPISKEREAAALTFARENHPELAKLIEKLATDARRAEYDRAVRQLALAHERLARMQQTMPERYELALAHWKLDSRVQLLTARLVMQHDAALELDLKRLLRERVDVRVKELLWEQARLENRLTQIDTSIHSLEKDVDATVNKEFDRIQRTVSQNRRPAKKKAKPAATVAKKAKGAAKASPARSSPAAPAGSPPASSTGHSPAPSQPAAIKPALPSAKTARPVDAPVDAPLNRPAKPEKPNS